MDEHGPKPAFAWWVSLRVHPWLSMVLALAVGVGVTCACNLNPGTEDPGQNGGAGVPVSAGQFPETPAVNPAAPVPPAGPVPTAVPPAGSVPVAAAPETPRPGVDPNVEPTEPGGNPNGEGPEEGAPLVSDAGTALDAGPQTMQSDSAAGSADAGVSLDSASPRED